MAGKQRYTTAQVIHAIRGSLGIKTAIAASLKCTRQTVDNYIKRYATVAQAYEEERERLVDLAEAKFAEAIKEGNWAAIRFALSTLGKDRGFSEKVDIASTVDITSGGKRIGPDFSAMTDDELREALAGRSKERASGS